MKIHGYFIRKVRNNDTGENEGITIFAIFCEKAKERGNQYTKRVLPPFVTPECNIMLANAMAYIAKYPQQRIINHAKAGEMLGTQDPRTIRKHICGGWQMVAKTNLELTQVLSGLSGFGRLPEQKPGVGAYQGLAATVSELNSAVRRMDGAHRTQAPPIWYVHTTYVFQRSRGPLRISLNHVLGGLPFLDTS